ncbi:outer membrane biogenesis protein BamB [Pseudobythopirellula maris]|uniref:Outer membrane biogenesis protein BamB n=1 Tax=Pseudobythopirellula maris TaxID=2527991 RepID=A0A5C5ZLI2_9BACT|nr:PQQ-binding-like beta-propeller repeat protein [Pseudobythopirellula maris]TWT88259.1 outer membrane biogenesis protein BamB [Pseudobythopirellula maris]
MKLLSSTIGCWTLLALATSVACADDWPRWRGPQDDGVWRESGVRESLPEGKLTPAWSVPCGLGYAGPAVAGGKVFLFEYDKRSGEITNNAGGRDALEGIERLRCLDATSGKELWRHEYDRPYLVSFPAGPRATPTVDGDLVYTLGAEGDLHCLRTDNGELVWSKSTKDDYGVETPIWGHSAAPLVVGDLLVAMIGGDGTTVVAFDKKTGEQRWSALSAYEPGYCPPSLIDGELVIFHPEAIVGLTPDTGETLWSVPIKPSYGMSIASPLPVGDRLFVSGYGGVSVFLRPPAAAGGEAEVLWAGKPKTSISCANSSPISDGEAIYGVDANDSALIAVDIATGERLWETTEFTVGDDRRARHGTVFLVRQGETDRYWLASETGDLSLVCLSPEGYEKLGSTRLLEPAGEAFGRPVVWSHPAFADRAVFARNDRELVRVSLAAD